MNTIRTFATLLLLLVIALSWTSCKQGENTDNQTTGSETTPMDDSQRMLDKEAFAAAIKKSGAVLIDVRMPQEFEQGHIEKAVNINFFDPEFKYQLLELNPKKKYYLYCKNETRSYRAMEFMKMNDFPHVYMLKGGYEQWNSTVSD